MGTTKLQNHSVGKYPSTEGEIASELKPSRREFLKAGASIGATAGATPLLVSGDAAAQGQNTDADTLDRLLRAVRDPGRRILLKGATVISMDAAVGDFVRADLLIEGKPNAMRQLQGMP
jgi:hypothetical protein